LRILVTGADGNVGSRLRNALVESGHEAFGTDIGDTDITSFEAIRAKIESIQPELVVHCAALTNVDLCAQQPDLAFRVNAIGTQNVALSCARTGAAMAYISTNEVFDGQHGTPYQEYDTPNPINPYGYSKWVGEQMLREVLPRHYIVRISWLFAHGGTNFLQKIVARAAAGESLSVVTNEVASPTYVEDLIPALAALIQTERYGIYHLANDGYTSRYEFARCILDCYGYKDVPIEPIISAQFPRPSRPPVYSGLLNVIGAHIGVRLRPWRDAVAAFAERERARA